MNSTSYETDVVAWANEQAELIRTRQFDKLDLSHIAEELQDVGKSEQRELAHRVAVLLMHLLKWEYQPSHRGNSWSLTIKEQRRAIDRCLKRTVPKTIDKHSVHHGTSAKTLSEQC